MPQISLDDIVTVLRHELSDAKLDALDNGYDSFETQLNSTRNPIALDGSSKPYGIINGMHRVYLARQKGYTSVPAEFI